MLKNSSVFIKNREAKKLNKGNFKKSELTNEHINNGTLKGIFPPSGVRVPEVGIS
jgi:hypothetical protein